MRAASAVALAALGACLFAWQLHNVDWQATRDALAALPAHALFEAAELSVLSYAVYCSFDLLAQRTTAHPLKRRSVLAIAFVGHACALSLGPAGAGIRIRLLMRHGLPAHLAAALWLFNVATNWLGFMLVAGAALSARALALPSAWHLDPALGQGLGLILLAALAAYLALCHAAGRASWTLRGVALRLPTLSVACAQVMLSGLNWLLLAGIVAALLGGSVPLLDVAGAVMASAIALAVVDVPAGLGVTETVFITLLGAQAEPARLLGALVAYRALYFVLPLIASGVVYAALEWHAGGRGAARANAVRARFRRDRPAPVERFHRPATDAPAPPSRPPA